MTTSKNEAPINALEYSVAYNIERWCYAVKNYPGEIHPTLLFKIVKQLIPVFKTAIEGNILVNLVAVAQHLAEAGKFVVSERELVVALASSLPSPTLVDPAHHRVLAQTLGVIEQVLPGTLPQIKEHWELERLRAKPGRS